MTSKIVHLALKVENLDETTAFYKEVFGFSETSTKKVRDHTSRHLTDGEIDFTLIRYDDGTQSRESKASGEKPCIHHFAIEVDDIVKYTEKLRGFGCEIVSDPGVIPVKFRAPGGTVAELVPVGRYQKLAAKG
jgi:lactoylglutathione lyase